MSVFAFVLTFPASKVSANNSFHRCDIQYILENIPTYSQTVFEEKRKKIVSKTDFIFLLVLFATCSLALKVTIDGFCLKSSLKSNSASTFLSIHGNRNNELIDDESIELDTALFEYKPLPENFLQEPPESSIHVSKKVKEAFLFGGINSDEY